jgi:hypothetical protein
MSAGRESPRARSARLTALLEPLAALGALAYALALALSLAGCGPSLTAAVTLHVERQKAAPPDASVTIDEQYVGPLALVAAHGVRLPVGQHRISIEKDGYFPFDQIVSADRDDIRLEVALEPIPD